jgi:aspartyl-tRNA(Asn)/glutamyl-tRNA(Gln) amidotransferase subunit A
LAYETIAALAPRLKSQDLSPVALLDAVLARIERWRALNAFITVTADAARHQAEQAAREIAGGRYRGPLHGVPLSLKDLIETRGIRTTAGSRVLADHVPANDATVTTRLREAGAVLLGKAALHEFAYGVTNNNPHFGPTRNPWGLDRIPGGSSGGSAAAVAAGLGCASIGTDTGGSIRIPAALCGVVGLKPSYGRVSTHGVFPLSWSLDHPGPLTRSVEDAAIVLHAVAGPDPHDRTTAGQTVPDFGAAVRRDVRGVRVGVLDDPYHRQVEHGVRAAFEPALDVLRSIGLRLERVTVARTTEAFVAQLAIIQAEAASVHERWLRDRPQDYGPETLERIRQGEFVTATQYLRAQKVRGLVLEEYAELLTRVDALVLPSVPSVAPRIGQTTVDVSGEAVETRALMTRFSRLFNFVGAPALSVPCGFGDGGLPVGLQIAGRAMDEETVIAIGAAYERATPWHTRRPPEPE